MKNSLCFLLLFISVQCFAQAISGLYSGTLVNDSTKKVQQYELALSEYKDKITGYAYTTFVVNDTFYYSIKSVKGERKNGNLVVEDVKMLANNFPESPAKGVRQVNIIPLPAQDTLTNIQGTWSTTKTKNFYSLSGSVAMQKNKDSSQSALIAHLTDLKIIHPQEEKTVTVTATPTSRSSPATASSTPAIPYGQRTNKVIQTIAITSDSLILSFYDNGIVDGDTISVYLDQQPILTGQLLTAHAASKTIYLNNSTDSAVTLTLVAENMGSLPPNTGLLIIKDGEERHQVNFSADLQTNAAIVFRKRRQP